MSDELDTDLGVYDRLQDHLRDRANVAAKQAGKRGARGVVLGAQALAATMWALDVGAGLMREAPKLDPKTCWWLGLWFSRWSKLARGRRAASEALWLASEALRAAYAASQQAGADKEEAK